MKVHYSATEVTQFACKALMIFADNKGRILNGHPDLNPALAEFAETEELGKSNGQCVYLPHFKGVKAERLLLVNVGDADFGHDDLRKAAAEGWKDLRKKGFKSMATSLHGWTDEAHVRALVEGFSLGEYVYTEFKTKKEKCPTRLEDLTLLGGEAWKSQIQTWIAICEGTNRARDLCQMPPNVLHPSRFAEIAEEWGRAFGVRTRIIEEDELRREGMHLMLSVANGSQYPAQFIIMDYEPAKPSGKTFAFVGKAVTFDSGGLSLKPPSSMPEMKGDMGGGAAVMGIMSTLKAAGCKHRVIGLVPAVENMPSGTATRPSDVVSSLSGLTVEINNTDAEGRLILADALTYASRFKPDYVIDFATLTGACLVALGSKIYAVMGNNKALVQAIMEAGEEVAEPFWELPLYKGYDDLLKSSVADVSNIGSSRWGGSIVAGLFLQRFIGDYTWAHCDIAACIFEKSDSYNPEGGNGAGVRMAMRMMEILEP